MVYGRPLFGRLLRWLGKRALPTIDLANRAALREQPFPDRWYPVVAELRQTYGLTLAQRAKLHGDVLVLLGETEFVGAAGFVVDDRVRVIIAASAALLVLGRDVALFDHVRQINVHAQIAPDIGGRYLRMQATFAGEPIATYGVVELGWVAVEQGLRTAAGAT